MSKRLRDRAREALQKVGVPTGLIGNSSESAVEQRRSGEGRKPRATTGKRGRPPTGRTAVLSTTIRPFVKEKLATQAQARGIGIGALIEEMTDELDRLRVQVALRGRRGARRA